MYKIDNPVICIVSGIAGSGKSTIGEEIAKKLINGVYLSKDIVQDVFLEKERRGDIYEKISIPTLKFLLSFVDKQLEHGKTPIIDAPFTFNHKREDIRRDWVEQFKIIADKHKARLAIIRCVPPSEEELKIRIKERGHKRDKWNLENWNDFLKRDPIYFPISHHDVYELITNKLPEELSQEVLVNYLNAKVV